jgi:hypothetical protein
MRHSTARSRVNGAVFSAVDSSLVHSLVPSQLLRPRGFLAPLLVLFLGEQHIEEKAVFDGKLLDPIEDVFNSCAVHELAEAPIALAPWRGDGETTRTSVGATRSGRRTPRLPAGGETHVL